MLAPAKPHVTWTTKLPTDGTGHVSLGALATNASNDVYVVTTENFADKGTIRRMSTTNGGSAWALDLAPDSATGMPLILSTGVVLLFAYDSSTKPSLLEIDGKTGASFPTTFGLDLYNGPPSLAVGADGSLYLVHSENVGTANAHTFLSRVRPDGSVAWTTPDLATLIASSAALGDVFPSVVALGGADTPTVVIEVLTPSGPVSVAVTFDALTGAMRWQTPVPGQLLGGPAIRPDGTIAILVGPVAAANLVFLDAQSGASTAHELTLGASQIYAITRTGSVIAGMNTGNGVDGLAALDAEGKATWTMSSAVRGATVAADGTIVGFGPELFALEPLTGATKWELAPPNPDSCVLDAALTSTGRLVGLQCDGTLFGAGD